MVTLGQATGNPLTSSREFGRRRSLVSLVLDEGRKRTICLSHRHFRGRCADWSANAEARFAAGWMNRVTFLSKSSDTDALASGARAPQFLIRRERKDYTWWSSLATLCTSAGLRSLQPVAPGQCAPVGRYRFSRKSFTASLLLHLVGMLVLGYLPRFTTRGIQSQFVPAEPEGIAYRLIKLDLSGKLPPIAPAGPGGHPGIGSPAVQLPALGGASRSSIITTSRPRHPDNSRQTIYQSLSPPDLRMTLDLSLPNAILGKPSVVERPKVQFNASASKPSQSSRHPQIQPVAPDVLAHVTTLAMSPSELSVVQPQLVVPPAGTGTETKPESSTASRSSALAAGDDSGLLIISKDPSEALSSVALPLGNRWGGFITSPAGDRAGSPAGDAGTRTSSGSGGIGAGGDSSSGVGHGDSGGGGAEEAAPGVLSISRMGRADSGEPGLVEAMVYPIPMATLPRRNGLVVSAGPTGGGGLNAYGTLHCGKIYTVFLEMPGRAWTLQYCRSSSPGGQATAQTRRNVVLLEGVLVPPEAETKFDFRRLPIPQEKRHKMIVLKGSITEQGTVENVQVHQGVLPLVDDAARLAFSRWKFKPALQGGNAVAVEILVGIPSEALMATSAR